MSGLNERMRMVIANATREEDRYKTLEEQTGIARRRWMDFMKGRQRATDDMIEGVCRNWKKCALWIVTGEGQMPEISKDDDTYYVISTPVNAVTLSRDKDGLAVTNVPHVINMREPYSPANFEWGYHGTGPTELAANVLFHFGLSEQDAREFAVDFSQEVISNLTRREDVLPAGEIKEWISIRLPAIRKARHSKQG